MPATQVLVSAASSLTDVFNDISRAFAASVKGAATVQFNFGASGVLLQQIQAGAPVDVFASASPKEMDTLDKANLLDTATRVDFAGNRLILIVGARERTAVKTWADLADPKIRHIAISNPASVPSGRYAEETLKRRGLWAAVQPRLVYGGNVRQTLAYVAGGDADAGIVFATDALIEKRVREVAEATPGRDHEPILYPAAVLLNAPHPAEAHRFTAFLRSPEARRLLRRRGFLTPTAATTR